MSAPLRVGTRGSALAVWQTEHVQARLRAAGVATDRVEIRTTGDVVQHVPLSEIGHRALFTRQIDDAMLERRIDLAVHSLKDLPTTLPAGIALAAVGEREDPRDALVGRGPLRWDDVPDGAVLATSSLRRRRNCCGCGPISTSGTSAATSIRGWPSWRPIGSGRALCWRWPAWCGSAWPTGSASGSRPT